MEMEPGELDARSTHHSGRIADGRGHNWKERDQVSNNR